ncbi:MAG: hypothetical protein R6V10_08480 [bacterium]
MSQGLQGRAARAFKSQAHLKFAATIDENKVPNVVPLLSARMIDPGTIAFVRFMVWKTRRNFESNHRITFACRGPRGRAYVARCRFDRWVTEGPLLEEFEREPIYRYNAYSGANQVGVVKVKDVQEYKTQGYLKTVFSPLRSVNKLIEKGGTMPLQVTEKWARRLASKFLGFVDEEGFPLALPHPGLFARDPETMLFPMPRDDRHPLRKVPAGEYMAASVLTWEPSAYQVKGKFAGTVSRDGKPMGVLEVDEVFTAAPPVPGKRIYPAGPLPGMAC